jgi:hypothetical protein
VISRIIRWVPMGASSFEMSFDCMRNSRTGWIFPYYIDRFSKGFSKGEYARFHHRFPENRKGSFVSLPFRT